VSLKVPDHLFVKARDNSLTDEDFLMCIKESLPYAWSVVARLGDQLKNGSSFAEDGTPPPSEEAHAELLRLVGSDAMRVAVERHFGCRLAFQNCCKVGLFTTSAEREYAKFVSPQAQLLNQTPALINC
jgi:hypothetical protein